MTLKIRIDYFNFSSERLDKNRVEDKELFDIYFIKLKPQLKSYYN